MANKKIDQQQMIDALKAVGFTETMSTHGMVCVTSPDGKFNLTNLGKSYDWTISYNDDDIDRN